MATAKKSTRTTKSTKPAKAVTSKAKKGDVEVSAHFPGQIPQTISYPAGTTFGDAIKDLSLTDGYTVSLNGNQTSQSTVLASGDIIRAGVKTKNAF